ncbi:MAG TPA: 3-oxoacyl-ACP synthase, partial [Terrimesophilobacter sp.]|nr:3-oxoacyl-ACP synthase [Terrimesophilobacter sp.]
MSTPTLKQNHGAQYTRLYGFGAARGDLVVPNDDLIGPIDSSDEWIQQRTGIVTRTRASEGLLAIDLATEAAKEAIEASGIEPEKIDLVIIATISNVQQTPSMAAVVADRVGANPAAAYDANAACAGYSYALTQADALIRS